MAGDILHRGRIIAVAVVHAMFTGFLCQDDACLSGNRTPNKYMLKEGAKRTGTVFHATVSYAGKRHPGPLRSMLLEFVLRLADPLCPTDHDAGQCSCDLYIFTNLDHCLHILETDAGMWTCVAHLTPTMCGALVRRPRLWLWCIPYNIIHGSPMTLGIAATLARLFLDSCVVSKVRDIDEYLLPDDHGLILYQMAKAAHNKPAWDLERARGRKESAWPEVHARLMERRGLNWWESSVPALDVVQWFRGFRQLTMQQLELLHMHNFGFPDSDRRQLDVHLSGDVCKPGSPISCPIVTPAAAMLMGSRCRVALPQEHMHMQSIHFGDKHALLAAFSDKALMDLAGNAWEATCAADMMILQETLLSVFAINASVPNVAGTSSSITYHIRRSLTAYLGFGQAESFELGLIWDSD